MELKGDNMEYKDLIGKTIKTVMLKESNTIATFDLKGKQSVDLIVDGDCCSTSWIESFDNPKALVMAQIISIDDIDMPDLGNVPTMTAPTPEVVKYYGIRIVTDRGHCVIDYRNDSNGYYGASAGFGCLYPTPPRKHKSY